MTTQTSSDPQPSTLITRQRNPIAGGAVLIILGIALLVGPLTNWQATWYVLPTLALAFLTWGLLTRNLGLVIPGGILSGIALGTYLMRQPIPGMESADAGGIFLLAFAGGWMLICLLSVFTDRGFQWWPLVIGTIFAFVGLGVFSNFTMLLSFISYLGPLALIGLGIYLVLRRSNR